MSKHHFLAVDLGATSGRTILFTFKRSWWPFNKELSFTYRELTRFPNKIEMMDGQHTWRLLKFLDHIDHSLGDCKRKGIKLTSMGIDSWGCDFWFTPGDGDFEIEPRSYRDPYTEGVPEKFFEQMPKEELYRRTGIQTMNFNTVFQLYQQIQGEKIDLNEVNYFEFVPDILISYMTDVESIEYTVASTSQMLNPYTKQFDEEILKIVGLPKEKIPSIVMPGTVLGPLSEYEVDCAQCDKIDVVAVASHDTASAVVAVPALNPHFAYLSSGTWSLMGIETDNPIINDDSYRNNFTNEGGFEDTIRFLKNITGMWLIERLREEWLSKGDEYSHGKLMAMAEKKAQPFVRFINPDDPAFANPECMSQAIDEYLEATGQTKPTTHAEYVRCIYESLALRYKEVMEMLKSMSPFPIECLHVIGGGSQNKLLNQYTANALDMPVIAGPTEATAIGNAMVQAKTAGLVKDRWEMRRIIAKNVKTSRYEPKDKVAWEEAYTRYKTTVKPI